MSWSSLEAPFKGWSGDVILVRGDWWWWRCSALLVTGVGGGEFVLPHLSAAPCLVCLWVAGLWLAPTCVARSG